MGIQYCEDKRIEKEVNEKWRIRNKKEKMFQGLLNDEYLSKLSREVLKPHFDTIGNIKMGTISTHNIIKLAFDYSKNEYYAIIEINGNAYNSKAIVRDDGPYRFYYTDTIYESKVNDFEVRLDTLEIIDNHLYHIYPTNIDDELIHARKRTAEETRKAKEAEKKKQQQNSSTSFDVDGIHVKFKKYDGNSFVFETNNILNADQVVKAIKRIGNGNMVQFYKGNNHYADYVYSTQCIIYKNTDVIYKVVNGTPIKAN